MKSVHAVFVAALLATGSPPSVAQDAGSYPERPVRVIVPWAAGGNADVLSRILFQNLSEALQQQFVVDNRGGANGMIGSEAVARAKPDGYTLLVDGVQTHAINPYIFAKMAYDSQRDFAQITLLGSVLHILVAHPSLPVKNTRELIALAKARPGDIAYSHFGVGTLSHLAGELFQQITGTKLVHVPYKGGGPALTGILGGEVSLYFPGIAIAVPHIKSGKLLALGLASNARSPDLPEVTPLATQLGAPHYDVTTSFAVMTPAGTSPAIVSRLHGAITQALALPAIKSRFTAVGAQPGRPLTPNETRAMLRSESNHWGAIVRTAGLAKN